VTPLARRSDRCWERGPGAGTVRVSRRLIQAAHRALLYLRLFLSGDAQDLRDLLAAEATARPNPRTQDQHLRLARRKRREATLQLSHQPAQHLRRQRATVVGAGEGWPAFTPHIRLSRVRTAPLVAVAPEGDVPAVAPLPASWPVSPDPTDVCTPALEELVDRDATEGSEKRV